MSYAETIFTGGRIFRGLREGFAEAVAIAGGRVVAVGDRASVLALAGAHTKHIDLAGRVAVPAFNDSHQHLLPLGLTMGQVDLRNEAAPTLDALLTAVRAAAAKVPPGQWIRGRGFDDSALDVGRNPTADELSAAAPNNPVFIVRTCGHVGVANHAALAIAGIDVTTADPPGGSLDRIASQPNGTLREHAMRLVSRKIDRPTDTQLVDAIDVASRAMLRQGFTRVMDANVGMTAGIREIDAYHTARDSFRLGVRTWMCLAGNPDGIADAAWARGIRPMQGDDMLRYGAMKVFCDGSAGGRTAAVTEPYVQGGTGMLIFPTEQFHGLMAKYHRQGWQLAIHAIGDAAIETTLVGMEAADSAAHPIAGRRHRIEHCEFTSANQIVRMAARGIEAMPQAIFLYEFGEMYIQNLGAARAHRSNPWRAWIDAGMHPATGSDAPVSATDPFRNIHTLVTRRTNRGTVLGGDQCLTVAEAVHAYTWAGAYSQFAEVDSGRIVPGQIADITVLSQDIFAGDVEQIPATQADLVLRGGTTVFDRFS
jgi:predicted amidohydrolase YtcJ